MAVLPSANDLSRPASARTGRIIASGPEDSVGPALQRLGGVVSAIGEEQKRQQDALGIAKAEAELNQGLINVGKQFDNDPDYGTFSQRAPKATGDVVNRAAKHISDPNLRERWVQGANTDAVRLNASIDGKADTLGKQATIANLDQALETQRRIYVDPETTEEQKQKARADIQATLEVAFKTGILTPDEADRRAQLNLRDANYSRAKLIAERDPDAILNLNRGSVAQLITAKAQEHGVPADIAIGIGKIESNLNPKAKAGTSSASGVFQLIDSTGKRYGVTNPLDANQNIDAGIRLTKDNINDLRKSTGREPTPGEVYLAHFSGIGTAQKLAATSDDAPASDVFSTAAIKANPTILAGKSVGEVKQWAERKMAQAMGRPVDNVSTGSVTPQQSAPEPLPAWYQDMSPEQREAVYEIAEKVVLERQAKQSARDKAYRDSVADNFSLRIAMGDTKLTSRDIIDDPYLGQGQKASLLKSYQSSMKAQDTLVSDLGSIQTGTFSGDPYNNDFQKRNDNVADFVMKNVSEEEQQPFFEGMIAQSGYVPQPLMNRIRVGVDSQNVADVQSALAMASRYSSINSGAISRATGGDGIQKKVDLFNSYKTLGYSEEEAAKRIAEQNNPNLVGARDAILKSDPVKKAITKVSAADVAKIFDPGIFSSAKVGGEISDAIIKIGASVESQAQIVADYKNLLEEGFVEANGNEHIARDLAAKRMQKIYGLSDMSIFGSKTVMRLPPEKTYNPLPDGSYDYIKEQLHDALKAEGVDFDEAWLESYDATDSDFQAGRPANYQIIYSKNGELGLFHLPFFADRNAALAKYSEAQKRSLAEREASWASNRSEEMRNYPEGRDGPERFGNGDLYRGIAKVGSPIERAIAARQEEVRQSKEQQAREREAAKAKRDRDLGDFTTHLPEEK